MRDRTWTAAIVGLIGLGCAWQGTPVPVAGDLAGLAGDWEGTYSSVETGRSGSITFALIAGTDSATGDVWMDTPQSQEIQTQDRMRPSAPRPHTSEALRIAFVRSAQGRVSGKLEPYRDPVTGEPLVTVFQGRLRGDEFRGTYLTRNESSGRVARGEWRVRRNRVESQ